MYIQLDKSNITTKKYKAIFYDKMRRKVLTVHFGQAGANDYTRTHDDEAKERYLNRHSKEDWEDFTSAGSLSRWLLWEHKSMAKAFNEYIKRFGLKKY